MAHDAGSCEVYVSYLGSEGLGQYQLTYRFAHFNPQQAVVELHGVMPCQGNLRMFNFLSRTFWLARAMIHD